MPSQRRAPNRYRLVAIASTVSDVVRNAGGYLFDHVASGWDVTVYVEDSADRIALQILGVTPAQFDDALPLELEDECPQVIVISAALSEPRRAIGRYIRSAIDLHAELAMWGPAESTSTHDAVNHNLSAAACAFKQHALIATAQSSVPEVAGTETFHRNSGVASPTFWPQPLRTRPMKA